MVTLKMEENLMK